MSWIKNNCGSILQRSVIDILKIGAIPRHVAIIMDGNRRYAKKYAIQTRTGHSRGFDRFYDSLEWCIELGIAELTVYAFSIENFKRSDEEVSYLLDLARAKFQKILEKLDEINKWGIQIRVIGRLSLVPEDLRILFYKTMLATRYNKRLRVNMTFAYTGRDELSRAATFIVDGVKNNMLNPIDIDEHFISETLELSDPDLLIRTSGETRLSDFMMWQVSNTVLYFADVLWPEFSIWDLLAALMKYQKTVLLKPLPVSPTINDRSKKFLDHHDSKIWKEIENNANIKKI